MAEDPQNDKRPERLAERIENQRKEIQSLVKQGGEQPSYEFKRTVSLGRDSLGEHLDFIKLLQALANSTDIAGERCIIIGADPKAKQFFPLANADEFDPANLRKILDSYLEPVPRFERFALTTDEGKPFVLLVVDGNQRRPIVVKKQGHNEAGKIRLEVGDIWTKKHTDTVRATRADIDAMYSVQIEEEAENRARKRLKHLQELGVSASVSTTPRSVAPDFELLVGPKNDLRRYADELVGSDNLRRFRMFLELARETLVQGWDKLSGRGPGLAEDVTKYATELQDFYTNEFLPSLEAIVDLGLVVVKHEADPSWLSSDIELLIEAFDASRGLQRVKSGRLISDSDPLHWWRPAFDIYIGLRTIAAYVILRRRLWYLSTMLPRIVTMMSADDFAAKKAPILFWPLRSAEIDKFRDGRAEYFWKERVGAAWGRYFGSAAHFLKSTEQLEFLLEFSSFFGMNSIRDPQLGAWMQEYVDPNLSLSYVPDLFKKDLENTTPMAEQIYDFLAAGGGFPAYLEVVPGLVNSVFLEKQPTVRLAIYGQFLLHLLRWQAEFRRQFYHYIGFHWSWPGRLDELVQKAKSRTWT